MYEMFQHYGSYCGNYGKALWSQSIDTQSRRSAFHRNLVRYFKPHAYWACQVRRDTVREGTDVVMRILDNLQPCLVPACTLTWIGHDYGLWSVAGCSHRTRLYATVGHVPLDLPLYPLHPPPTSSSSHRTSLAIDEPLAYLWRHLFDTVPACDIRTRSTLDYFTSTQG